MAVLALLVGCAAQKDVVPAVSVVDLNQKVASGKYVQKVDAFEVIFDTTTSMNDPYKNVSKLDQEKSLIRLFNDTIPRLKLNAAGRVFGQMSCFGGSMSECLFGPTAYEKSLLPKAMEPFTSGQGESPLDEALDRATADLKSQTGQLAVIVFSDGEDMAKYAPVAAAQRMKNAYGDRVCIYTVHIGGNAGGREVMRKVADAGRCGFMATGDSVSTPAGMADFVEKVFLKEAVVEKPREAVILDSDGDGVPDHLDKCPGTPAGVKVDKDGCPLPVAKPVVPKADVVSPMEKAVIEKGRVTLNVTFDFDKATIRKSAHQEIENLASIMKKYPDLQILLEGHTCNIGGAKYNEGLSSRRAEAVKKYLVEKFGIDAARLSTKGYGFTRPVASNATKAGRQKNRRVEAAAEYIIKK